MTDSAAALCGRNGEAGSLTSLIVCLRVDWAAAPGQFFLFPLLLCRFDFGQTEHHLAVQW